MHFQADILNVPVAVNKFEDCSALGVALLAAKKMSLIDPRNFEAERVYYYPRMNEVDREKCIKGWKGAVQRAILKV
jgi:glycerol kinase